MSSPPVFSERLTREARIRASLLLKAARKGNEAAIRRLGGVLKHRRALDIAAQELGHPDYQTLRATAPHTVLADPTRLFNGPVASFLNHWFATYDEARRHMLEFGGVLFPFRTQHVVVEDGFLTACRLDPTDADWQRIGRDWVRPADIAAFTRLNARLCAAGFGPLEEPA